ncbi:DUF5518 domain-containing protein [Halosimplex litoreum]|uniref:DUF5518 domain-containing protein n=1 Tax=Halosimplex litoreum TaxID=1198301 RepID=A0A7U3WBF6_9EURY|nr:DUF5518 domain-containing protein [Halosimplex litoreum]QPV64951.1 DUF5518 domain-containing protein [Halosimplex litoreum]
MTAIRGILLTAFDERWRPATLAGLASVPFTVAASWDGVGDPTVVAGGTVSGLALVVAAVAAGYYYGDRRAGPRAVGTRVGLAGSIGVVVVYLANAAVTVATSPASFAAVVAVLAAPVVVALGAALSVLVAVLGAAAGDWLGRRTGRGRRADPTG